VFSEVLKLMSVGDLRLTPYHFRNRQMRRVCGTDGQHAAEIHGVDDCVAFAAYAHRAIPPRCGRAGWVTHREYDARHLAVSRRSVNRTLAHLVANGQLEMTGSGPTTGYGRTRAPTSESLTSTLACTRCRRILDSWSPQINTFTRLADGDPALAATKSWAVALGKTRPGQLELSGKPFRKADDLDSRRAGQ
jgi:hypothetical protein